MKAASALGAFAAIGLFASTVAHACPSCAARPESNLPLLALVGGMIGVPYVIAVVAISVIRRADRKGNAS